MIKDKKIIVKDIIGTENLSGLKTRCHNDM